MVLIINGDIPEKREVDPVKKTRHGNCQMFYASKIPNFLILIEKTRKLQYFWQKIENRVCFVFIY